MRIVIDVDDTIAKANPWWKYPAAKPIGGAQEVINKLASYGHEIILWTARFEEDRKVTEEWLDKHGIRYHKLVMGKPRGDIYIDNCAIEFRGWDQVELELKRRAILR